MVIADGKLLFCHVISEESVDKQISTREYNNRAVYDCFNNTFTDDFGIPALNLPPITIYDRPHPHKRDRYTPDVLAYEISVASENSVSTLTTTSDSPDLLPCDYPNLIYAINKYEIYIFSVKIGYCWRKNDEKICYKIYGSIAPHALIKSMNFITVMGFPGLIKR